MKTKAMLLGVVLCLTLAPAAPANPETTDPAKTPAGQYELDKRHASLIVRVGHMGFSHYTMRFTGLSGSFVYDPASWQTTKATITVDPKSIDTTENSFDRTVAGYFEPDKYPVIQFVSTELKSTGDGQGELTGDLTLHGVTKPVTLKVVFNGAGPGLLGAGIRMGFSGVGRIKRSEFNVTGGRPWASDDVDLMFEVEFVKK
ncbi:YceI family protein [Phenylobacterium sp. LjRoot225]|uniref:YceI family protein n=1 Tax=Phenylobacterium sp. LjRoot225 TaxID=3342285 RepID=UPI003ECE1841